MFAAEASDWRLVTDVLPRPRDHLAAGFLTSGVVMVSGRFFLGRVTIGAGVSSWSLGECLTRVDGPSNSISRVGLSLQHPDVSAAPESVDVEVAPSVVQSPVALYRRMYYRMLSGKAALDTNRFMLHFSKEHDTRHGAIKGTISTNVAKFSYRHRIHRYL